MIDYNKTNIGYVAGRLCALLEHYHAVDELQGIRNGEINVALACQQPSYLLKQFNLSVKGIARYPTLDALMTEIVSKLNPDKILPKGLPASEQTDFMLAYFNQKEELKTYRIQLGNRLIKMREAKGMTQKELSEASGITQANISKIEKGKYSVGLDVLSRIATALECDLGFQDRN